MDLRYPMATAAGAFLNFVVVAQILLYGGAKKQKKQLKKE